MFRFIRMFETCQLVVTLAILATVSSERIPIATSSLQRENSGFRDSMPRCYSNADFADACRLHNTATFLCVNPRNLRFSSFSYFGAYHVKAFVSSLYANLPNSAGSFLPKKTESA